MLRLAVRLPAGRYHATPWGRHVNEGEIEWPPSPWRLYRTLLATGFNKLGWTTLPSEARALVERLAASDPAYHLPAAVTGHTRHYLPQFKGATAKVIDAFAYVGRGPEGVLGVEWDVELPPAEAALLDALVARIAYLGRAESWAAVERVDALPAGLSPCRAAEAPPGAGHERIALLAPLAPDAYARWREEAVRRETDARLAGERAKAAQQGKAPPKALAKKAAERVEALFPEDLMAVLLADTSALQRDGWSQPPGSRWVSYWRAEGALPSAPATRGPIAETAPPRADTALLTLASDTSKSEVLPRLTDALPRAEALHGALVSASDRGDGHGPAECFTGKDEHERPLAGHQHASLLPLALERAGRLDHVLVYAPMGFDARARTALAQVKRVYAKGLPDLFVTLAGIGERPDFEGLIPSVGEAEVWESSTPFVPVRHLKERGPSALEGQVQAELASRGLPAAVSVEVELEGGDYLPASQFWRAWSQRAPQGGVGVAEGGAEPVVLLARRWRHFKRERSDASKKPPISAGFGLRLRFAAAVRGPIALGYASHFGLGGFVPG